MLPKTAERRKLVSKLAVRSSDAGVKTFVGTAVVYNKWSEKLYGYFQERIAPGAFAASLASARDVIATIDHDPCKILGRISSKTLRLLPGDDGIDVEVDNSNYSYAGDLEVAISRNDLTGMSFTFDVIAETWDRNAEIPSRTIVAAELYEVAFVYFPAYPDSSAGLRSIPLAICMDGEKRAIESARASCQVPLSIQRARVKILELMYPAGG